MRSLDIHNTTTTPPAPPTRTLGPARTVPTNSLTPRQPQPINLREAKEAPSIDEKVILTESLIDAHGSSRVCHHLQDVIAPHRPREVDYRTAGIRVVYLLTVREYETLAAGDAPHQRDVVLLAPAGRAGLAGCEGVGIGEAETPSDPTFRVRDALAACHGGEVDGVEGTVTPGAGGVGRG